MKAQVTVRKRWDIHRNGTDRFFAVYKVNEFGQRDFEHFYVSDIDEPEPYLQEAYDAIGQDDETLELEVPEWFFAPREHWSVDTQRKRQYETLLSLLDQRAKDRKKIHPSALP
jgi:hypothetical protein